MFEVPDAKRVRREDLYSSSDEEEIQENESSQQNADLLRQKLSSLLAINLAVPPKNEIEGDVSMVDADQDPTQPPQETEANQEEEFAFRLFSSAPAQKVVLAPKEEDIIASSEDIPFKERPLSYYIRPPLTPEEQEQIRHSALSGQDVLALSRQRAWGLEVPWRVTRISIVATNTKKPITSNSATKAAEEGDKKKKKRPGKKSRIKLRIKAQKRKEEESKKLTKEEHLKEKKKRLNREKKLKRRQKEKAKKAANGTVGGQEEDGDKMSEDEGSTGEE
ncbi:hypothetical protein B0T21DRAFT_362844 [Apiosordaria backusii]|uniref:Uncharacterized protein n=1 Tax=Apiosordaria backusii TaxID=314023 RepID=A0AA40EHT3_9PEZI|nr:hypothetical protein B0T21DRAFT_362844 [Apiosordaria backusii]